MEKASIHQKKRSRVSFESLDIVEFEPTVHTATVTSGGIAVGMSLEERSRRRRRLNSFEEEREESRIDRQDYMDEGFMLPDERRRILGKSIGFERQHVRAMEEEIHRIIEERHESNEVDQNYLFGLGDCMMMTLVNMEDTPEKGTTPPTKELNDLNPIPVATPPKNSVAAV